jgi:integrase
MSQKLTKTFVENLPNPDSGQVFYRDSELKGFALRVGKTSKVYVAESKIAGKTIRVTIGKHGVFTTEEARSEAKAILGQVARHINPNDELRAKRARSVTCAQVQEDYLKARKNLKPTTIKDYRRIFNTYLGDWANKPLSEITKDMVERHHRKIGERSPAQANLAFRYFRALVNFAMAQYEDSNGESIIRDNPVRRLSQTRAWYRISRRQTLIKHYDLAPWYQAVMNLTNTTIAPNREVIRDFLLLVLMTGLRRSEAAGLTWNRVDLKNRTITIKDTKNREDHILPITDYLFSMLSNRKAQAVNQFVFPNETGIGGLVDPKKQIRNVVKESGVEFTVHDLRRTFITIAESLDIPAYALKRLLNHKMNNDVTAGYIIADVERLREPMQKITDYILRCVGEKESASIVTFPSAQTR